MALFVYLLIAVAELRMRRQLEREAPDKLKVKMWLYPWLIPSLISLAVVVAAAFVKGRLDRGATPSR